MERDGGDNERRKEGGPSVKGKGIKVFSFSFTGGEGRSPVRRTGDRGLVSSLPGGDSSGQDGREIGS